MKLLLNTLRKDISLDSRFQISRRSASNLQIWQLRLKLQKCCFAKPLILKWQDKILPSCQLWPNIMHQKFLLKFPTMQYKYSEAMDTPKIFLLRSITATANYALSEKAPQKFRKLS